MTETGSPSPYAGSDDTVGEAAQPDLMSGQHVIKPVPPETAGETIPADPPSGENVIEVRCCPSAVEFFGAVVHSDPKHFGYDPVNNRTLPNEDSPVYWFVGPQKNKVDIEYGTLSEPASRTEIDGSVWLSVGVGETTRFAAEFLGSGCFENVTFESQNPDIAVPLVTKGKSTLMEMAVKGVGVGETTIFARCDGQLVGWVHIWCAEVVTIRVAIGSLVAPGTVSYPYDVAQLETYLSNVFGQARVLINLIDVGDITMPDLKIEDPIDPIYGLMDAEPKILAAAAAKSARAKYALFFYAYSDLAQQDMMEFSGEIAGEVGEARVGYIYQTADGEFTYQTVAHELGHLLNLSHPVHDFDHDEFPQAHRDAMTDPDEENLVVGREDYLMGYGSGTATLRSFSPMQMNSIGYMQWKKIFRE